MNKRISVASPPGAHQQKRPVTAAAPEDNILIKYTTFWTKFPEKKLTTNWLSPDCFDVARFHGVVLL